jgi:type III restriction enzyme
VCDTDAERAFADALEAHDGVKLYAKLPAWFRVTTPLGSYHPDWAVLAERDDGERLYFVVDTPNADGDTPSEGERAKLACGEAHFRALADGDDAATFVRARDVEALFDAGMRRR